MRVELDHERNSDLWTFLIDLSLGSPLFTVNVLANQSMRCCS